MEEVQAIFDGLCLAFLRHGFTLSLRELDKLYIHNDDNICVVFITDGNIKGYINRTLHTKGLLICDVPLSDPRSIETSLEIISNRLL